jgi:anthranilate synthase component 2
MSGGQAISSGAEAFLLSPGPCTPNEAGISLDLVGACADAGKPLLGVCLGHQSIGQYFGGKVVRGGLMHGKTSPVRHDGTGSVLRDALPLHRDALSLADRRGYSGQCLVVNATADDGSVMGFRHAELPIHSVQFHPESIATEYGHEMLANFMRIAGLQRRV